MEEEKERARVIRDRGYSRNLVKSRAVQVIWRMEQQERIGAEKARHVHYENAEDPIDIHTRIWELLCRIISTFTIQNCAI